MSLGTWLSKAEKNVGNWLAKTFTNIKDNADVVAITITEAVKATLLDGVLPAMATVIDTAFKTTLAADVVAILNANINKILAVELAIQGLPDNPTEADVEAFSERVVQAITGLNATGKSKLYTTLAAQVYGIIETEINNNEPMTFAKLVDDVEEAWQDYQADLGIEDDGADG